MSEKDALLCQAYEVLRGLHRDGNDERECLYCKRPRDPEDSGIFADEPRVCPGNGCSLVEVVEALKPVVEQIRDQDGRSGSEHSPTPWTVDTIGDPGEMGTAILDANDRAVCILEDRVPPGERARLNAERIVNTVNRDARTDTSANFVQRRTRYDCTECHEEDMDWREAMHHRRITTHAVQEVDA